MIFLIFTLAWFICARRHAADLRDATRLCACATERSTIPSRASIFRAQWPSTGRSGSLRAGVVRGFTALIFPIARLGRNTSIASVSPR